MASRLLTSLWICLSCSVFGAELIQQSNRIDWIPGVTVGVRGGVQRRTVAVTDVTQAPYNANNSGGADAYTPIQAAIDAASSNAVIYLPAGLYDCTAGFITLNKSGVTLRGAGTNTIIVGKIIFGHGASGEQAVNLFSGVVKGATNLVISTNLDIFGSAWAAGDQMMLSQDENRTNDLFQVISIAGYQRLLQQPIVLDSVSNGTNCTFWPPAVWNYTNAPRVQTKSLTGVGGFRPFMQSSLEDFLLTTTNSGLHETYTTSLTWGLLRDSWITNVVIQEAGNYSVQASDLVSWQMDGCNLGQSHGLGTSHSGFECSNLGGGLMQNNIIAANGQLGLMFNSGVCGNAFFANFFTNNGGNGDVLMHNSHPVMNLWEANYCPTKFLMDGYFGSSSHQTIFRNRFNGTSELKRFTTYCQIVGNVCGDPTYNSLLFTETYDFPSFGNYPVWAFGFPNIGNQGYSNIAPAMSWNFPQQYFLGFGGEPETNGLFWITNAPSYATNAIHTNMGIGRLSNLTNYAAGYTLRFQEKNGNTNKYWLDDSNVVTVGLTTDTNVTLNQYVFLTNNWIVWMSSQNAYQQLQKTNKYTHTIAKNGFYTNNTYGVIDSWTFDGSTYSGVLSNSLLYTTGPPGWWGTNRWPAVDPDTTSQPYAAIPAQDRYYGIGGGAESGSGGIPQGSRPKRIKLRTK